MPASQYDELLDRAAKLWNIDAEFWDIWGHKHTASPDVKRALLAGLGVSAGSEAELERAIEERARTEWSRLAEPCVVAAAEHPVDVPVNAPEELKEAEAKLEVRLENGGSETFRFALGELSEVGAAQFGGEKYVRKRLRLPALPLGYHEALLRLGSRSAVVRLIVGPSRAYQHPELAGGGKLAGIAVALYGLRSGRNWGCGDFTDLRTLAGWVADETRASFIALNPLHAIHNRRPFNTSPYLPNCVYYQNFIYLDVEAVPEFAASPRAGRLRAACAAEIEALRAAEYVEFERVSALKLRFLKLLFAVFLRREYRRDTPRACAFRKFIEKEGDLLERFAVYCALDERLHARNPDLWVWPQWPAEYQDPESDAVRAFRSKHWRAVMFYQYLQWQIDAQLSSAQRCTRERSLAIGLYHDLALATDRFGSDLWAHRPFFVTGCQVGSPPDDFSPQGQDWGFPPPNSEQHRESGYRLFVESIRKNCRHGGALRIDHVMRFFRLYWIPEGARATEGTYVRDRWEDLLRILALESVRNQVTLIGEDLGTVEPFVREALAWFGVLSYRLLYFEKTRAGGFCASADYPVQALVSATTHDLPTIAGFWVNEDIEARRRAGAFASDEQYRGALRDRAMEKQKMLDALVGAGLLPPGFPRNAAQIPELTGELHNAVIGYLALTPAQLLLVNQEDLTKELAQQNLPATTWQYPNWGRKMKYTVEELRSNPAARDFTAMFRNWLVWTGRVNR